MKEALESLIGNHHIYKARREEFQMEATVPFRVSPEPFKLGADQTREIKAIGHDITEYMHAVDELYHEDYQLKAILDKGKPEVLLANSEPHYLFVRPDIIITPSGFSICEIETSPFGLALAEILNRGYLKEGYETLVGQEALKDHVHATTPTEGTIIYTKKTSSYQGQMSFLADKVFSGNNHSWHAADIDQEGERQSENIYRGFYQGEYLSDPSVKILMDTVLENRQHQMLPSLTPHLEEKAILAVLWDKRWQGFLEQQLGPAAFHHLRKIIPPTWIVGQEEHFALGMPNGVTSSLDLATLSRSKRTLVLKPSGFAPKSSWAEGVNFLHEKSSANAKDLLHQAEQDDTGLHIVQEFRRGSKFPMEYEGADDEAIPMTARIRLTPYYAMTGENEGKLVALKATGCENTDYIHGSSTSINTAVS